MFSGNIIQNIINHVSSRIHNSTGKCAECSLQKGVVRELKRQHFESKNKIVFYLKIYIIDHVTVFSRR